jgi:hypothetical protein
MFKKLTTILIIVLISLFFIPFKDGFSAVENHNYPKIANYFLKWDIADHEVTELAKWDLLILDMEVQENSRANLKKIRKLNPDIIILAYITSQEIEADIHNNAWSYNANLRKKLANNINESWWLKDINGEKISFWPGTYMLNLSDGSGENSYGQKWNDYLPYFVKTEIISTGLWDGIFYDNIWGDICWIIREFDIDNDKSLKSINNINNNWSEGVKKMLKKTRELIGDDYLIIGNGRVHLPYQNLMNGVMLEGFLADWESNGDWGDTLSTYNNIRNYNQSPPVSVINSYDKNKENYQKLRFGLTSTLMERHGYFSFDFDVSSHSQLWWYDEYDVSLGSAISAPYNLLKKNNEHYSNGLWRRDFEEGVVITNSTNEKQLYVFEEEEFQKISGKQDRRVNDGSIINYIEIPANDGIILLKRSSSVSTIKNNSFNNGDFVRIFNEDGEQVRSGFFAYLDNYPANSQILISDINSDGQEEVLVNSKGIISIYKNNNKISEFQPYDGKFKGEISFSVADLSGDGNKSIITGAGRGGGPHVRIFDINGNLLTGGFFAYDKNFRGGVNVAVMDLNANGKKEIISAAGPGGGPHIRVFDKDGTPLIGGFFAYEEEQRHGISLTIGDLNSDGQKEIITALGPGGKPEIKIFDKDGNFLKSFLAYDQSFTNGLRVMAEDLNNDGKEEVLVGSISF